MIQTRAVGVFALVGLAITVSGVLVLGHLKEDARQTVRSHLSTARPAVDEAFKRREASQAFAAEAVANSGIPVAIDVLDELRRDLKAVETGADDLSKGADARRAAELRQKFVSEFQLGGERLVDTFVRRLGDRLFDRFGDRAFGPQGRAGFETAERTRFVLCLAVGVSQCFWDYSFVNLNETLSSATKTYQIPLSHRVILTDGRGVGLADSDNDKWSNDEDFAVRCELARAARTAKTPQRDLITLGEFQYLATAIPLTTAGGKVVGSVIVADPINRWMAKEDSEIAGFDVIYAKGAKLLDTAMDPEIAGRLVASKAPGSYESVTFPIHGLPAATDGRVIVAADLSRSVGAIATGQWVFLGLAVFFLLIGAVAIVWILRRHLRDLGGLYQGIHEVINGNLDYAFPLESKDEIVQNLSRSLNLMSAVMQHRMPPEDEDESPDSPWAAFAPRRPAEWDKWQMAADAGEAGAPPPGSEPELPEDVDVDALRDEPAEAYYKRLYTEFVSARRRLNLPFDGITQEAFMLRLVHLEQKLKKKHSCRMVRFVVVEKGEEVVLVPVPLR